MREHYWFLYRSTVLLIYALLTQNNLFLILFLKIGIKNSKNVSFINRGRKVHQILDFKFKIV